MTKMLVFTLHPKVDAKLTIVNEIKGNLLFYLLRVTANKCQKEKGMTLKEDIKKMVKDYYKQIFRNTNFEAL